jgi:hypothetical protein
MAFAAAAARSVARLLALLLRGPLRALPDREKTRLETQTLAFIAAALRRTAPPSRGRVAVNRRGAIPELLNLSDRASRYISEYLPRGALVRPARSTPKMPVKYAVTVSMSSSAARTPTYPSGRTTTSPPRSPSP